jgi:hypothetical protein
MGLFILPIGNIQREYMVDHDKPSYSNKSFIFEEIYPESASAEEQSILHSGVIPNRYSTLSDGMYYVRVSNESFIETHKIVVEE